MTTPRRLPMLVVIRPGIRVVWDHRIGSDYHPPKSGQHQSDPAIAD